MHAGVKLIGFHTTFSNSRSLILFSSRLSKIIPSLVVDLPCNVASRSMQYHKMFTKLHVNKPSLVCVYIHNGNCCLWFNKYRISPPSSVSSNNFSKWILLFH